MKRIVVLIVGAVVLGAGPAGASAPPLEETAIAAAVAECEVLNYSNDDVERFFTMDEGHSVLIHDFAAASDSRLTAPRIACIADELGLPEWLFVRMTFTDEGTVNVPGYTIAWSISDDSVVSEFLIYDSEVGGGLKPAGRSNRRGV